MAVPMAMLVEDAPSPVCTDLYGVTLCNGLLYVTDRYSGAVVRMAGATQLPVATIDAAGILAPDRIGGIASSPDGTLYVARLGHGQSGAIFRIAPDGDVEPLPRLPARFVRHGVAYDAGEHVLYTTQFMAGRRGAFDGSIVAIDLASGHPSTILDGFLRPTGIAKLGDVLVVADARQRAVFRVDLVAGRAVFRLQLAGDIDRPDSVCACGDDSVLVTTYDDNAQLGAVRRLSLDGKRSAVLARGPWEPRGIATDGARMYVATNRVLVFPL